MNYLVTGGVGRLGSELVKLLVSSENTVRVFDLPSANWEMLEGVGCELVLGDVNNLNLISKACEDVDVVIHLAAILPPKSEVNRNLTMKVNVEGTRNIIKALNTRQRTNLIFASSISTYGVTATETLPLNENRLLCRHSLYAESKIDAESLIRSSRVPHVILRIAPIAVTDLVELPEIIPYRPDQRVEFVHITDAAQALFEAARNQQALGEVLNISGGASWQMTGADYIREFYDALGVDVDPVFSEDYTALDWYDTSRSRFLGYQRTKFNMFLEELRVLGEQLGLR